MKVDLNELAKELTLIEGKKEPISIAQVKEVMACQGARWRRVGFCTAFAEFVSIYKRAGKS